MVGRTLRVKHHPVLRSAAKGTARTASGHEVNCTQAPYSGGKRSLLGMLATDVIRLTITNQDPTWVLDYNPCRLLGSSNGRVVYRAGDLEATGGRGTSPEENENTFVPEVTGGDIGEHVTILDRDLTAPRDRHCPQIRDPPTRAGLDETGADYLSFTTNPLFHTREDGLQFRPPWEP